MKVILIKDIPKIGQKYEVKEVSSGHALNFLIPQGLAIGATTETLKKFEVERAKAEGERKLHEELLAKNIKDLDGITLTVSGKANEKGHLFAGFHREALAEEIFKQTKLQVDPSFIELDHPLKEIGEHQVTIKAPVSVNIGGNKSGKEGKLAKFKVVIEAASN